MEQAIRALRFGVHVLVEKPFADNLDQARKMLLESEKSDTVLAAGHTFRHHEAIWTLVDRMGEMGKLLAVEVSQCVFWDGPKVSWWADRKPSEGLIVPMFAPHALDFVQLIMQAEPMQLSAIAARHQRGWQAEDEVMIQMSFPNGRLASVHLSYNQGYVTDRKTIFFENGVAQIENGVVLKHNGKILVDGSDTIQNPNTMGGRNLSGFFVNQLIEFKKAIVGMPNRICTPHDSISLMKTLDRVLNSVRETSAQHIDHSIDV
jgi:predicted dehydrogenase